MMRKLYLPYQTLLSICKALKDVLPDIFKVSATEEEICNHIRNEFRLLQMEEIPESFYRKNIVQCPKRKQPSYWEKAFELAEIPNVVSNDDDYVDIEYFVNNLAMLNDVDGRKKYRYLVPLYMCFIIITWKFCP